MSDKKKSKIKSAGLASPKERTRETSGIAKGELKKAAQELSHFEPKIPFSYLIATRNAIREKDS